MLLVISQTAVKSFVFSANISYETAFFYYLVYHLILFQTMPEPSYVLININVVCYDYEKNVFGIGIEYECKAFAIWLY